MNEAVISSYETFYSGPGLPSDLSAEMAAATLVHASTEADYHKTTSQPSQHETPRRYHHSTTYNNSFMTTGDVTAQTTYSAPIGFSCNNNNGVSSNGVSSNGVGRNGFTQIPFVQIHTTDVQPQSANNNARFRRNASSNHEEIKAEPIKSENADGAKERINATPTPPESAQQRSENNAAKNLIQAEKDNATNNVNNSDEIIPNVNSMNGTQRRSRIYLKNVECLREPHRDPIEQQDNLISDSLFHFDNDDSNTLANIGSISMEDQDIIGILTSGEQNLHSKSNNIDNVANEAITAPVEVNNPVNPPKQKISIKSVDVLREPALMRRDYEMQAFDDFNNICSVLNLHDAGNICEENDGEADDNDVQYSNYAMTSNREPLVGSTNEADITNFTSCYEKPRKPKIYIKNVDILKEPMTFSNSINVPNVTESNSNVMNFNFMQPSLPQIATSYLENVESLNPTVPPFNGGMSQLPLGTISDQYLFDNGGGNFLVNTTTATSADTFTYGNEANSDNFLMESSRYVDTITPIMIEPTPPPQQMDIINEHINTFAKDVQPATQTATPTNIPKQKIFIKNVDILKEPQFQEPRGLLHLRTVDELNLMNRKEVENLIAPNLEGNQSSLGEEDISDNFTQLNNGSGETSAVEQCTDSNAIEAISYGCEGFKLNEFSTQNSWHDDYDLGDDIREIITSTMTPSIPTSQKIIHDLDTPQVSLISIPDMEELTGTNVGINISTMPQATEEDIALPASVIQPQDNAHFSFECEIAETDNALSAPICDVDNNRVDTNAVCHDTLPEARKAPATMDVDQLAGATEELKPERLNQATPGEQTTAALPQKSNTATNFSDIPPLTPMSSVTYNLNNTVNTATTIANQPTGLPVPPLVPMLPPIQLPKPVAAFSATSTVTAHAERGRIYVANNLMQTPSANLLLQKSTTTTNKTKEQEKQQTKNKTPIAVSVTGGTSVRGRPFGSNRTGITKMRKHPQNGNGDGVYLKCTITGCAFRFKKSNTLEYHIKCHSSDSSPVSMACPECKVPFTNWNSLHTHLWRTHKIDMELYSCELCSFKTPIYSRLLNTHSKIHYDERNYKCDQCEKAFKNTKQLKNHRRWHRNHNKATSTTTLKPESTKKDIATNAESKDLATTSLSTTVATVFSTSERNFHRCKDCDAVFSHQRTLREHLCKNGAAAVQCEVCERVLTSRSSLKLHMQSHEPSRRFKCSMCDYSSSDHNAFRRHKMTHDMNAKMYSCAHCDYKSIQSVAYQRHVQQKHPQVADSIVYKCKICTFATINKALFDVHQVKHATQNGQKETSDREEPCSKKSTQNNVGELPAKTKIKVKSHLLLTTPADSTMQFSDLCFDVVTVPA
ncbi:general transcriptional corepressor trfA [Rhagoletis pomonella]|uniref:general transcriptional corepressor trfA n=1 Tax=Rhagoletis pomonella TaxID=28610 RepID=UPI001783156D|nr:general transcriptional corepressor trfA [Rhagoletis pomonella]